MLERFLDSSSGFLPLVTPFRLDVLHDGVTVAVVLRKQCEGNHVKSRRDVNISSPDISTETI
jgi:hypothetical protein